MRIINKAIIKVTLSQYLYIYIILSYGGMAMPNFMGNNNFILLTLFLAIYEIFIRPTSKTIAKLQHNYLFFISIFFATLLIVVLGSTLSFGTSLNITTVLLLIYAAYKIDTENFIHRFLKVIFILAVISLIFFSLTKLLGLDALRPIFPYLHTSYYRDGEIYSYGGWIYQFVLLHEYRNCGPFGEPGKYQCILAVALYFVLFRPYLFNKSTQFYYSIVFFITLITTQSTSGYIALTFIIVCYLLHPSNKEKSERQLKRLFIVLILFSILFMLFTDIGQDFMHITIYDKIMGGSATGDLNFSANSGSARTESIIGVLSLIEKKPILLMGVGYDELFKLGIEACAGLLFLLLAIGILPYSILFGFSLMQVFKYNNGIWDALIRILLVINMGLGQPHIINGALFIMLLYPYFKKNTCISKTTVNKKYVHS